MFLPIFLVFVVLGRTFADECPKIVTQKPFDLNKYLGLWYEIYRTDLVFQTGTKCVNATYTPNSDGSVGVWNQAINKTGQYTNIRGVARVKNPSEPAALIVTFDNPGQTGNYNVITSKYDEYSLVYSCRSMPSSGTKIEIIWFLSRTKTLSNSVVAELKKIVSQMGADPSTLSPTLQNC